MNPDTDRYCHACGITYDDVECPSCNPKHYYFVEVGVPDGPDDFTFQACGCNDCPNNGYWNKREAISHAEGIIARIDSVVRVCDDEGTEVWANR